jgi:multicomponent Na+:H+ antiporter subunit A
VTAPPTGDTPVLSSLILRTGARTLFSTILVVSVFLLFSGHNSPGGGFTGGLVAGAAFVLRFVACGSEDVGRLTRLAPETFLGVGLLFAGGVGVASLLLGLGFLETGYLFEWPLPALGVVKLHSAVVFDVGVYLVVAGLVLAILRSVGANAPEEHAAAGGGGADR